MDLSNADELTARALEAFRTHGPPLVIDLSAVAFMDSSGVKSLLAVRNHARREGSPTEIQLRGVTRAVLRTLSVLGVTPLFALTPTVRTT